MRRLALLVTTAIIGCGEPDGAPVSFRPLVDDNVWVSTDLPSGAHALTSEVDLRAELRVVDAGGELAPTVDWLNEVVVVVRLDGRSGCGSWWPGMVDRVSATRREISFERECVHAGITCNLIVRPFDVVVTPRTAIEGRSPVVAEECYRE